MSRAAFIVLVAAAFTAPAAGQEAGEATTLLKKTRGNQDIFAYDFGPPKSPAMTLLGLDFDASPPSTSLKAFVVSAANLFDGGGASAAIDIAPAALLGSTTNFDAYSDGTSLYRIVRRSRLGLAAINGTTGDEPVQSGVAVGFSTSLFDSADPLATKFFVSDGKDKVSLKQCMLPALRQLTELATEGELFKAAVAADPDFARRFKIAGDATERLQATGTASNSSLAQRIDGYNDALAMFSGNQQGTEKPWLPASLKPLSAAATDAEEVASRKALDLFIDSVKRVPINAQATIFDQRPDVHTLRVEVEACATLASRIASFSADFDIGAGAFWRGKPGQISDLKTGGGAVWAALQLPLSKLQRLDSNGKVVTTGSVWMLGASGRYGRRETIATGDDVTPDIRADTLNGWVGIENRSESLLLSARYGYQQVRANDPIGRFYNRSGDRFLVQGQVRLGGQSPLWLGVAYGNAGGTVDTYNAKRLLVTLAFSPPKPDNITGIED